MRCSYDMLEISRQAIEMCKPIIHADLDYSVASLELVEKTIAYIRTLHHKKLADENALWNMSVILGAYCGEVYLKDALKEHGFEWQDNEEGIPVVMDRRGRNAISPITKIYKKTRIPSGKSDEEGDVISYYEIFLSLIGLY